MLIAVLIDVVTMVYLSGGAFAARSLPMLPAAHGKILPDGVAGGGE